MPTHIEIYQINAAVVSQNLSPTTNETVLDGNGPNSILASTQREYFGEQERCLRSHSCCLRELIAG
jgi:hypothetical protein